MKIHKFPIGTRYKTRGKNPYVCTVTDRFTVINEAGYLVRLYYSSEHTFLDQVVLNTEVVEATIMRGACDLHGVNSIVELAALGVTE
jgi:hypothetical protein